MDTICQCAICGATTSLAEARITGWMAYPPMEHGDDPQPPAQPTGPSLRCGACVLGLVLMTVLPRIDDDAELLALREGYRQAVAHRAALAPPANASTLRHAWGRGSLWDTVRTVAHDMVFLPDPAASLA